MLHGYHLSGIGFVKKVLIECFVEDVTRYYYNFFGFRFKLFEARLYELLLRIAQLFATIIQLLTFDARIIQLLTFYAMIRKLLTSTLTI